MATCRSVINSSLRKIGVLAAGREARATDATDALGSLQSLYMGLIDSGAFGRLRDVIPIGTTYTACGNERIFRNSDATLSVTLPEVVSHYSSSWNGLSLTGNYGTVITITTAGDTTEVDVNPAQPIGCVNPPRDCAVVVINDAFTGTTNSYVYDGSLKLWKALDGLGLDDEAPLSARNPDGFASMLAMSLVDEFGGDMPAATARSGAQFQSGLVTRFSMPRVEAAGIYL